MIFPIHVYKCPGDHHAPRGLAYKVKTAEDSEHHAELIEAGWFATLDEAITAAGPAAYPKPKISAWRLLKKTKKIAKGKKLQKPQVPDKPEPDDNAPPTRAELETKARELGIAFDGRTTDRKLGERIAASLTPG